LRLLTNDNEELWHNRRSARNLLWSISLLTTLENCPSRMTGKSEVVLNQTHLCWKV
jgi:hypothetical protein